MGIKTQNWKVIDVTDLDELVEKIYGKPYSFQQQDGCKERDFYFFSVPEENPYDYENDAIPETINGEERGVSFAAWKVRDPKAPVGDKSRDWEIEMFWHRNFYPHFDMIINDLYKKGEIEAGEYYIDVNW